MGDRVFTWLICLSQSDEERVRDLEAALNWKGQARTFVIWMDLAPRVQS
jgi:hypothetical protein